MHTGIDWTQVPQLAAIGLLAGTSGGLIGLGGSVVMVPALTLLMGRDQHLSQAAAMIVNVAIAVPAATRHHMRGAVRWDIVRKMLPFGVVFMVLGVALSNVIDGELLKRIFGVFLLYVMAMKVFKMYKERNQEVFKHPHTGVARVGVVGALMGGIGGLTGTAGGPVAVPLLQRICHVHLKDAIAISSAVMCVTSAIGAAQKNWTLHTVVNGSGQPDHLTVIDSLFIAACIIPTAVLGSIYGAGLTHKLPLFWVRIAFVILITWAALLLLGVL